MVEHHSERKKQTVDYRMSSFISNCKTSKVRLHYSGIYHTYVVKAYVEMVTTKFRIVVTLGWVGKEDH